MNTTLSNETTTLLWGYSEILDDPSSLRSVQALLFGELVQRAIPVTEHYLSDLFHDAQWIEVNIKGETNFDFLVRQWGTNIGLTSNPDNSARANVRIGVGEGAEFYHVRLFQKRGKWQVTFTQVPLSEVRA